MKIIDELLEKYFEGETSLQEENILREYFAKESVAEEHKIYAPMFKFFVQEQVIQTSNSITLPSNKKHVLYFWFGIAASILVVIFSGVFVSGNEDDFSKSLVYIDGKQVKNIDMINVQALESITNISDLDEETINSQISVLDLFTD